MKINFKSMVALTVAVALLAGCAPTQYKPIVRPTVIPAAPATNELIKVAPARAASLELIRTAPADGLVCDPIPVSLTISNSGGRMLTGVQLVDTLPKGLTRDDPADSTFKIDQLAPGDSRTFQYNIHALSAGKFTGRAKATAAEDVTATASTTTLIHQPVFVIAGQVSAAQMLGRKLTLTYVITNTGDAAAADAIFSLPVPAGLTVNSLSGNGQLTDGAIAWNLGAVDINTPQTVSATFIGTQAGDYQFNGTVKADCAVEISGRCRTQVIGVSALSLQKIDGPDPIAVGELTTFTVKVTNQGSAADTNVAISVEIAPELEPVGSDNRNAVIHGRTVTFPIIPILPGQAAVIYSIVAKGVKAGDAHTKFNLNSAALKVPISAEESTRVY